MKERGMQNTLENSASRNGAGNLPTLVSEVYRAAPEPLRAKLLECLLRPVGPLALAVIASGAFGMFLARRTWTPVSLSIEEAARVSVQPVFELAAYLEQSCPEVFSQLPMVLSNSPLTLATGGSALLLALQRHLQQRAPGD
jgi:hypothetical protein